MAGYTEFQVTEPFLSSLPKLLANDKSALTWNAGTAFPTEGLSAGMPCFRTDENKLYIYSGTAWEVMLDFADKPLKESETDAKFVAYSEAQSLEDAQKDQARANINAAKNVAFTGATSEAVGEAGLVPKPNSDNIQYNLFGDGAWRPAKVRVQAATDNAEHPMLVRLGTGTGSGADEARIVAGVTVNPSTKTVKADKFSGKVAWTDITDVPTNVKNAVSFVEGQTLTPQQAQIVRLKILTAYQTSQTGSLILPNGTIAQRDSSPTKGAIRFNSEKGWFEGYTGSAWVALVTDPAGKNLPTGTCLCGLFKEAPDLFLSLDGSRINKSDYYDLCNLLWGFSAFRGDGSTYAILPNMHHRFFEGTTSISEVATYVEAGLPNITGRTTYLTAAEAQENVTVAGAFFWKNSTARRMARDPNTPGADTFQFDASISNNKYGQSSVIQPQSIRTLSVCRT